MVVLFGCNIIDEYNVKGVIDFVNLIGIVNELCIWGVEFKYIYY